MIFSPISGTPTVIQGFGQNPQDYAAYGMAGHNGIDFAVPVGTTVYAPHDGMVIVKDNGTSDYGLHVIVDDGRRRSYLAHLSQVAFQNGQSVSQGDPVGLSGKSGDATGPHLHWTFKQVQNGVVQHKNNGYQGAIDVTEFTRLWLEKDLHHDAVYLDQAKPYLAMTFTAEQYLKRNV